MTGSEMQSDLRDLRSSLEARAKLDPARQAKIWRKIERDTAPRTPWLRMAGPAVALAATVMIGVLMWPSAPQTPTLLQGHLLLLPQRQPIRASEPVPAGEFVAVVPSTLEREGTTIELIEASSFRLLTTDLATLNLYRGKLTANVPLALGRAIEVRTKLGSLRLTAGRADIALQPPSRIAIKVESGTAVWSGQGEVPRTLLEGEALESPPIEPPKLVPTHTKQQPEASVSSKPTLPRRRPPRRSPPPAVQSARSPPLKKAHDRTAGAAQALATVEQARKLVRDDPDRAGSMAKGVLEGSPASGVRVRATLVLADARRRQGALSVAAELYAAAAESNESGPFTEEARFREAQLRVQTKDFEGALNALSALPSRGSLVPERTALAAQALLELGRIVSAAERLESAGTELVLQRIRLRVAKSLTSMNPDRALKMLQRIEAGPAPRNLRMKAATLIAAAQNDLQGE